MRRWRRLPWGSSATPRRAAALVQALKVPVPIVQGRAAEALGLIGDKTDAPAVGAMVRAHVKAGALDGDRRQHLDQPLAPAVEAVRLGLYALARLGSYDALASAVLDRTGSPCRVVAGGLRAAACGRRARGPGAGVSDARRALHGVLRHPRAGRGQGHGRHPAAAGLGRGRDKADRAVVVQAIRALAALCDAGARPLLRLMTDASLDEGVRSESMAAFASGRSPHGETH